jgi:epsin
VRWGEINVFYAKRQLLANAFLDRNNERFMFLLKSCISISNFSWAHEYITKSQHSFIDFIVDISQRGQGRYLQIQHLGELEPKVSFKQWRKGSQWFEMSRKLAMIVVSDTMYYPKFTNILYQSELCFIDEHYIPIALNMLKPSKIANRTLTYFVFPNNGTTSPHPF